MPSVHLVRHGQASFGEANYDKLSELGRRQARTVGEALRARGVVPTTVVTGEMARQTDTAAEALAAFPDRAGRVIVDERWNEYDYADIFAAHPEAAAGSDPGTGTGSDTGSDTDARRGAPADMRASTPREFQRALDAGVLAWIEAGGTSSSHESWPDFTARVEAALTDVLNDLTSGQCALVFTSAGPIAAVCARLLAIPPERFVALNRVMVNASVTTIVSGRGGINLLSMNEHGHLEGPDGGMRTYR